MGDNKDEDRGDRPRRKKSIDMQAEMQRKALARLRFRSIIRTVIDNLYWLLDEEEETDNVKDRVKRVMKKKKPKGKLKLTVQDKLIMMKLPYERTKEENRRVWKLVGGFKCFRHYPTHVKRHLTVNSIFTYYGPGRVIVREGHTAKALYFILSGKVEVTKNVFDEVLEKIVSQSVTFLGPGDVFGEISLLYNIERTSTVTTVDDCEFLRLGEQDFQIILLTTVQKQWDAINTAMSMFSYFDAIDENAKRDGCYGAKILSFKKDDVILGDGKGLHNFAYFILTGSVQIIESLKVITEVDINGVMQYTLYDPDAPVEEEEDITTEEKLLRRFPHLRNEYQPEFSATKLPSRGRISTLTAAIAHQEDRRLGSYSELPTCKMSHADEDYLKKLKLPSIGSKTSSDVKSRASSRNVSRFSMSVRDSKVLLAPPDMDPRISYQSVRYSSLGENLKKFQKERDVDLLDSEMRTYFMEVCRMIRGSTFGLGENMRDRRVVALEKTKCLVLPIFFLMMHNTANIWTRIKYYLNKKIPDKKVLFKAFVKQQRWARHREQIIFSKENHSYTTMHDVPLSLRLEHMYNIAY